MTLFTNSTGTGSYHYRAEGLDFPCSSGSFPVGGTSAIHGFENMMADVSRNGSSFSINDKRSYDAWSRFRFASFPALCSAGFPRLMAQSVHIRSGASTGDPKGRYPDFPDSSGSFPFGGTSAIHGYGWLNLGHVEDDESNLIYMRARYYDPTSGRFLSEDPDMASVNLFEYSSNQPTNLSDSSGRSDDFFTSLIQAIQDLVNDLIPDFPGRSAMIKMLEIAGEAIGNIAMCEYISKVCSGAAPLASELGDAAVLEGAGTLSIVCYFTSASLFITAAGAQLVAAIIFANATIDLWIAEDFS